MRVRAVGAEESAFGGGIEDGALDRSPRTDADGQCEFRYQPEGWGKAYRFVALRYQKKAKPKKRKEPEQYQLFDAPEYHYRVSAFASRAIRRSQGSGAAKCSIDPNA